MDVGLGKDAYSVLGLDIDQGLEATEQDIRKCYRKLALKWHPDKNKDKDAEYVAKEFDKVQKAYDILSDKKAREALDNYLQVQRKRELRLQRESAKRLKMVKELELKERESFENKSLEKDAAEQLKRELERLRERMKSRKESQSMASTSGGGGGGGGASNRNATSSVSLDFGTDEEKERSLKASWGKRDGDYSVVQLKELFGAFGKVQDVVVKDKVKKASAIVVMATKEGALNALGSVCGSIGNPLLVVPFDNKSSVAGGGNANRKEEERRGGGEESNGGTANAKNASHLSASFEKDVLAKMRAAAAAKRKRENGK